VSQQADWGRMAHELSHFFAGGDLYGGPSDASAAPFDMMGNHDSHPIYSGYNMEKRLDFDETAPPKIIYKNHEPGDETKPIGNGDPPWVGHDNTLFALITNQGMVATPQSVKVTFYVNTPPGIGDNGTWAPFDTVDVGVLNPGETKTVMASRPWSPTVGEHTCVKVFIEPQTGEVTFDNNQAQENFGEFETAASSPYQAVELDFLARNPYDVPGVMDILARNVPADWFVALNHGSVWLPPKGEKKVHAVIWTDRDAEWASDRKTKSPRKPLIELEGWMDRWFDQNFAIGGVTAFMQAVRKVALNIEVRQKEGKRDEPIWVTGQVMPPVGVVPVAIHVTNPVGKVFQQRLQTDNAGAFTVQLKASTSLAGTYKIQAFVLGGTLAAEAESPTRTLTIH